MKLKKEIWALLLILCLAFGLIAQGCGGGGSGGGTSATPKYTVSGTVYAPNGTDPVADCLVYVPGTSGRVYVTREEIYNLKDSPPAGALTYTYTGANGTFSLPEVPKGTGAIYLQKGLFKKTISGEISGDTTLTTAQTTMTTTSGSIPRIAVITGYWDRMQDVLAKLGLGTIDSSGKLVLGTEKFTLIDGDNSLDTTYTDVGNFVTNSSSLANYDIIFINCGASESPLSTPAVLDNIRNYVANGGRLYVTDLAKDYVDDVFDTATYISFIGEVGTSGITVNGEVLDSTLLAWLKNFSSVVNADNTVTIEGFLSGWAVISDINTANVKPWIRGPVTYSGGSDVRYLTTTFGYGSNKGKVLYSSYHTHTTTNPTVLNPQERILEYLVFEVSE